jgi:hypothetical protein
MGMQAIVTIGIFVFSGLTLLFDLNFARRRFFIWGSAESRVRFGMGACVILIVLLALDVYLTLTA